MKTTSPMLHLSLIMVSTTELPYMVKTTGLMVRMITIAGICHMIETGLILLSILRVYRMACVS